MVQGSPVTIHLTGLLHVVTRGPSKPGPRRFHLRYGRADSDDRAQCGGLMGKESVGRVVRDPLVVLLGALAVTAFALSLSLLDPAPPDATQVSGEAWFGRDVQGYDSYARWTYTTHDLQLVALGAALGLLVAAALSALDRWRRPAAHAT